MEYIFKSNVYALKILSQILNFIDYMVCVLPDYKLYIAGCRTGSLEAVVV